jgi:minichromosome maintenance protein 10
VAAGKRDLFVNENVGREAQARASRLANSRDTDAALKRLLARDKEGMRTVQEARKFAKNARDKQNADNRKAPRKDEPPRKKRRKKEEEDGDDGVSNGMSGIDEGYASESDGASPDKDKPTKNAYSARVIKELGFDPTALKSSRGRRKEDEGSRSLYTKVRPLSRLLVVTCRV